VGTAACGKRVLQGGRCDGLKEMLLGTSAGILLSTAVSSAAVVTYFIS